MQDGKFVRFAVEMVGADPLWKERAHVCVRVCVCGG